MLKVRSLLCPIGGHIFSYTRFLFDVLNVLLLGIGVAVLYVCCTAYLDLVNDVFFLYHYAPLNVIVITAAACVLIIATLLNLVSQYKKSFHGLLTGAIILSLLILVTLGYTIWRAVVEDYSPRGRVYRQLAEEFNHYNEHKNLIDRMQSTLECCGLTGPIGSVSGQRPSCYRPKYFVPFASGCFSKLKQLIAYYNWMILIGFGFLCGLGATTVALSYVICRTIKHLKSRQKESAVEEPDPAPEPEPEPEAAPAPAAEPEAEAEPAAPPPPPPPPGDQ